MNTSDFDVSKIIAKKISDKVRGINGKMTSMAYRASNELRNASLYVLRGQRSGRIYKIPFINKKYQASKTGESPAVRTGIFRLSWNTHICIRKSDSMFKTTSAIESSVKAGKYLLGDILENGTSKMAPRPYKQKVIDMAMPNVMQIYKDL